MRVWTVVVFLLLASVPAWAQFSPPSGGGGGSSVSSFNGRTGSVTLQSSDVTGTGALSTAIPSASVSAPQCGSGAAGAVQPCDGTTVLPSGTTATTQSTGDTTARVATDALVNNTATNSLPSVASTNAYCGTGAAGVSQACGSTQVLPNGATATTQSPGDSTAKVATDSFVATSFAPLASPAFTGAPTAPTAAAGDNSSKIATTGYVVVATATPNVAASINLQVNFSSFGGF